MKIKTTEKKKDPMIITKPYGLDYYWKIKVGRGEFRDVKQEKKDVDIWLYHDMLPNGKTDVALALRTIIGNMV